ncbi:hypothetical protein JX580_05060 [Thiomicrospira microaerophila]|uniref:hypothetical protein n=1 Tax=Thiomicrospira microaerophila TaxID=406020 RepID=UPI0020101A32|nr:hypothetical protein [Thiomicrospira microaerophila]UQB43246.1 hypothetical protein JX580_05060 [Thiomicrospira microaerophila]
MLKKIKKHPLFLVSLMLILLVSVYWGKFATDRYVSEARVVLQSPEIAPPSLDFSSMLTGNAGNTRADLLMLREVLMSADTLKILDQQLNLRKHFANTDIDYISRLASEDVPIETFHKYYLKRINIRLDDYSGVLIIKSSAFDKDTAHQITQLLIQHGEAHMNEMGKRLALEQVNFIELQVQVLSERLEQARKDVIDYQNREGMISPTDTAGTFSMLVSTLTTELAKLNAEKSVLSSFQSETAPDMIRLNRQIEALKKQIQIESAKLTEQEGRALNTLTAEYETLLLRAQFAQQLYSNAIATLEGTRVEAARKLKQVSMLQYPSYPEYAIEPKRLYHITVYSLFILLASIIIGMVQVIIKDHRD